MNDEPLHDFLRKLPVPTPAESARDRAKHRALLALQSAGVSDDFAPTVAPWRRAWPIGAAFALGLFIAGIALWPRGATENFAEDRQLLLQIEQVFPHHLNAVVQAGGQTSLSIDQSNQVGDDQPIVILFRRQHDVIRVLSFSGHRVCVPFQTGEKCFDVLESPEGNVILAGDQNVVVGSQSSIVAGYAVKAQRLSL